MREHFEQSGHTLLFHNLKTWFAELDLVFLNPAKSEIVIVEVKSGRDLAFRRPISPKQAHRLKRAQQSLSASSDFSVTLHLAAVMPDGKVQVFENPLP